jgi:hypothetical protein
LLVSDLHFFGSILKNGEGLLPSGALRLSVW